MRKLLISAVAASVLISGPALAWGGGDGPLKGAPDCTDPSVQKEFEPILGETLGVDFFYIRIQQINQYFGIGVRTYDEFKRVETTLPDKQKDLEKMKQEYEGVIANTIKSNRYSGYIFLGGNGRQKQALCQVTVNSKVVKEFYLQGDTGQYQITLAN